MAGAVSALFLLDIKGRVLIWRDFRGDVTAVQAERFFTKLIEKEGDVESHSPVVFDDGISYMFIQHNNVFLMTAARQNCNAASILLFLHRVIEVFKHYFEELEEESLRDNFVVVYELLDEMMDFGYPQYTEAKILSEFIKTDAYRMEVTQRPPMAVTNAVSWRSEGVRYKKNEVFLDVVESVNILVNSNGQIIRSDVVGALKMRTYLSGMPECKLGLNDRVLLEAQGRTTKGKAIDLDDIKFHQCVRLARFENDRTISFIPPDGAFDLMTYRLSTQVKPPIWVEAQVERHSRSRIEIMVKARSQFKERSTATNVEIELPVPSDSTNPNIRTSMGSATYAPEHDALVWKIKSFPGGKEYMCRAEFSLPSVTAEEAMPEKKAPIRVKFEIPYFTVSGIQVLVLKIVKDLMSYHLGTYNSVLMRTCAGCGSGINDHLCPFSGTTSGPLLAMSHSMGETLRYLLGVAGPSGFGSSCTAEQVTQDIYCSNSNLTAIITGATSGIGAETARVLAKRGVRLVIPARDLKRAAEIKGWIKRESPAAEIILMQMDLSSFTSIQRFCSMFLSLGLPLNILINNAGKYCKKLQLTEDKFEMTFATNYLGHYLLTEILLERMVETSARTGIEGRIVNVSSVVHTWIKRRRFNFYDMIKPKDRYNGTTAYAQSKLANIMHTKEMARRLRERNAKVTINAVHPGIVKTGIIRDHKGLITDSMFFLASRLLKSTSQGASTACYVALSPQLMGVSGKYFVDCNDNSCSSLANNELEAQSLWEKTHALVYSRVLQVKMARRRAKGSQQ
ncbi:AP-1 complex subunit mu-2 [Canna indica]|uniref:AP-1 complex subunit mu-2 n=2 Tax=Magnoliopsida TaxID=3398 RepID=A0AAQ3QR59_9LILI|nr:AP-1 complex subunit mu-2 [Canna indica]